MSSQSPDPQRLIAFLRAINVGGHVVKMDELRRLFEALGFMRVETFIASGNVIFESADTDAAVLERQIERHLRQALGYEVVTFIRSASELTAIAAFEPFSPTEVTGADTALYIAFTRTPLSPAAEQKLLAFRGPGNDFHVREREIYCLYRTRISDSPFTGALLEKTIGQPATMRNSTTVRKLAAKYPAPQ